jgi:hypothetical protein
LPARLAAVEYPGHHEIRRVSADGAISWSGSRLSVSTVLIAEDVGLEPIDDGLWDMHLARCGSGASMNVGIGSIRPA